MGTLSTEYELNPTVQALARPAYIDTDGIPKTTLKTKISR
jgi:hypothetical protein